MPLKWMIVEAFTIAKRDFAARKPLEGFGGHTFRGRMDCAEEARKMDELPVGLARGGSYGSPGEEKSVDCWRSCA